MIEGQEGVTWQDWLALAGAVEDSPLDGLFRSDHYTAFHGNVEGALDAWSTVTALAAVTRRIRLGTLVSPVGFRHPSLLARQVASADRISGGRVELGIGTGWHAGEHAGNGFDFPDLGTRFEVLGEQLEILVNSWTREQFDFQGRHYTLAGQRAAPRPVQVPHPPIVMGGAAKARSLALAARYASEYNVALRPLADLPGLRVRLDAACTAAGRDPATLALSLMLTPAIGRTDGEARARKDRALARIPNSGPHIGGLMFTGTVPALVEHLRGAARAGVTRAYLQHMDFTDLEAVKLMGEVAAALA
ncbi:MAG: TIGR03560 family F420-dependent LLM class oxidoreductase [Gammaproteobacteria bacterium]